MTCLDLPTSRVLSSFFIIIIFYIIVAFCCFGFSLATKCQISVYTYLHMWKMLIHPASLPVFVQETHYFVVGMFKCHACKCYGNRYSSYGSKVEDLINIQGALVKLFCCSVHRYWHRRPWITWGRSEFRCVNFVQSKKLCANNRIKWKWS